MRYRFILLPVLALGVSTCGDRELPTGPVALAISVDSSKFSSTCKAIVRARNRARMKLAESPTDLVAQNKASTFEALLSETCS